MMQHRAVSGFPIGVARVGDSMRDVLREQLRRIGGASERLSMRWFAVRVMTGREMAVENQLAELGVAALVPMRKGPDLRRRGRIIAGQMMPVIHGYVLVKMPLRGAELVALQAVDYMLSVVGGYDNPMPITDEEVKRFKDLAQEGVYDWERPSAKRFRSGDRVELFDGPFVGMKGEVQSCRSDGKGDVVVTLEMFGGKVPVTVPVAFCEKL